MGSRHPVVLTPASHTARHLTMDSKLVFPAALLVLCCLIDSGAGIKCYQCNSYEDALCADPFRFEDGDKEVKSGTTFLKDCVVPAGGNASTVFFCRKLYQNVRGDERVIRSCGWIPDHRKDRNCYTTVLEEYNTEVCACDNEDGCNSADMRSMSLVAILSSVVLGYLIH